MGSGSSSQSPALHKAVDVPNLKIAITGDPEVGKTSILSRYIRNQFSPVYIQTYKAAIENVVRKFNVPGHAKVPITFWDIPGHEDLPLHSSYFTDLDAVIVVVDLSVPTSLESAVGWRQTVLSSASFTNSDEMDETKEKQTTSKHLKNIEDIPFLLMGNKLDLCLDNKEEDVTEKAEKNMVVSNKVQQLEEIAGQGFTGSIAVSARNNDMSVHAAIQAFLRHMLEHRGLVQRKWVACPDNQQGGKPSGRPRYEQERQLKVIGVKEIDTKFDQAEEILYRVASLQRYQEDSRSKFSTQCVEAGVIANSQDASMQNCLVALRDKLIELDLKLQLKLNDEFCHLEVKASSEDAHLDKNIRYAIKTFNKEYAAVTKAILAEFPVAESKLSQIESQVDHLCKIYQKEMKAQKGHGLLDNHQLQRVLFMWHTQCQSACS
ncbi:hypothetical protein RRG08_063262 [Elysia crispata]|uniref:Uncharacterized protein n=1 Tax=Elysia crispata TaxID=231223 RepID=A0AAE0XP44_9GAST|nr:hypothetical protein RRG08_063262 [Elysia crispata]